MYVDSPAGTGLSYSDTSADYHTNDTQTITDLLAFVKQLLLSEHSRFASSKFYIAGESYAGVYVPLLAEAIVQHNQAASGNDGINLVGYMVGNGVTDDYYDGQAQVEFAYGMDLIDTSMFRYIQDACKGQYWNATRGSRCWDALGEMEDSFGPLNIYSILDPCTFRRHQHQHQQHYSSKASASVQAAAASAAQQHHQSRKLQAKASKLSEQQSSKQQQVQHQEREPQQSLQQHLKAARAQLGRSWPLTTVVPHDQDVPNFGHMLKHTIACADRRAAQLWFNSAAARQAIHAAEERESGHWEPCSDVLHFRHNAGACCF